jgi:hypothetical protein
MDPRQALLAMAGCLAACDGTTITMGSGSGVAESSGPVEDLAPLKGYAQRMGTLDRAFLSNDQYVCEYAYRWVMASFGRCEDCMRDASAQGCGTDLTSAGVHLFDFPYLGGMIHYEVVVVAEFPVIACVLGRWQATCEAGTAYNGRYLAKISGLPSLFSRMELLVTSLETFQAGEPVSIRNGYYEVLGTFTAPKAFMAPWCPACVFGGCEERPTNACILNVDHDEPEYCTEIEASCVDLSACDGQGGCSVPEDCFDCAACRDACTGYYEEI